MKILYLISFYDIKDGSSDALYSQIKDPTNPHYLVICKWLNTAQDDIKILEYDDKIIDNIITLEKFDLIHYFKSRSSNILDLVVKKLSKHKIKLPIVTTTCQNPSFGPYMLSPYEIKNTSHFVFIDRTSFNDSLIKFIPNHNKSLIYLSAEDTLINRTENIKPKLKGGKDPVIFGRGSTLLKCPSDMFDVFDAIDIPNKELHIVGVPLDGNWVHKEAEKRKNVKMFGYLPFDEWFDICKTFDVFLYQLPEYCHASLDGNLGLAMLMRIPVVYYGCEAPKERFINGENGFVANTKEQFTRYATDLGLDPNLRLTIGENGRSSTIKQFSYKNRIADYNKIYHSIKKTRHNGIRIPLKYWLTYLPKNWRRLVHGLTGYYRGPK